MTLKSYLAETELVPKNFDAICPAEHPRSKASGMLARNRATGIYVLLVGGAMHSVPHKWAQDIANEAGKSPDAIQDQCIAQMNKLGLNPNQVAEQLDGQVSRSHVCDYLTRRSSIGSHKLQHVLAALKLRIA